WGTGLFVAGARAVLDFAFAVMGIRRLEARSAVPNGRGNGALRKLGATREAVLRQSFERHGERLDQALWTLRPDEWWTLRGLRGVVH
ncbi:MAG: GNAT family N-acetyltransferase, partial [Acidobacteriota bacterium]|nr:GNAT family N-acetyltransferase [Acidobacteriota bacterium]